VLFLRSESNCAPILSQMGSTPLPTPIMPKLIVAGSAMACRKPSNLLMNCSPPLQTEQPWLPFTILTFPCCLASRWRGFTGVARFRLRVCSAERRPGWSQTVATRMGKRSIPGLLYHHPTISVLGRSEKLVLRCAWVNIIGRFRGRAGRIVIVVAYVTVDH